MMDEEQVRSKKRPFNEIFQAVHVTEQIRDAVKRVDQKVKKQRLSSGELSASIKDGFMLFLELRQTNRSVHEITQNASEQTKKYRERLNLLNLELQNLQYEKNHYLREIQSCKNFPSALDNIGLVSLEVFLATAPKECQPTNGEKDPHSIMLKRLEYELKQRMELQETLKELKTRLKLLLDDNARRETFLAGLQNKLQEFSEASKPIQQYIPLSINSEQQQKELLPNLPKPLYFLYTHLFVYKEASGDDSIMVELQGEPKKEDPPEELRFHEKEKTISLQEAYDSHPLTVVVTVVCKKGEPPVNLILRFIYLIHLNIVTLKVSSTPGQYEDVLIGLFPNDLGNETPNLANYYMVREKNFAFSPKIKGRPFRWVQYLCGLRFLPERPERLQISENFHLEFSGEDVGSKHPPNIQGILAAIQQRIATAQTLQAQLDQFAKGRIPVDIKTSQAQRSAASLVSWSEKDADSFYHRRSSVRRSSRSTTKSTNVTQKEEGEVEEGEVEMAENKEHTESEQMGLGSTEVGMETTRVKETTQDHNRYFRAVFECDKDRYKVHVCISPYYPHVAPIFRISTKSSHKSKHSVPAHIKMECDAEALSVANKTSHRTSDDINIKFIQAEVNLNYRSLLPSEREFDRILSYQMRKLNICVGQLSEVLKKGTDTWRPRPYRGRDRRIVFL